MPLFCRMVHPRLIPRLPPRLIQSLLTRLPRVPRLACEVMLCKINQAGANLASAADGGLPGYDPGLQVLLVFIQDFDHPLLPVASVRLGGRAGWVQPTSPSSAGWVQPTPPSSGAALSYTRDSDEHISLHLLWVYFAACCMSTLCMDTTTMCIAS